MEQPPSIIQHGAQSQANVNTGNGTIVVNNNYQQINTLSEVSKYLRSWYSFVYKEKHIERAETEKLWNWITRWEDVKNPMDRVSLLVGDAGSGKSVVMHDLLLRLENEGIKTLGLKSDLLFASESDLDRAVGLGQSVSSVLSEIANAEKVVLLVDQIDALSSTLSSNRKPLQSVNSLVAEVCQCANARIVVSCRPYDQQYDPSLDRYSNRNVVTMGELSSDDVDSTLALVGIQIENDELLVKKFLANPLNLYLFCKVSNGGVFAGRRPNRTILYEALWKQIVNDKSQETDLVDVKGLTSCLDMVSTKMYERQVLAIPSKQIETLYPYELTFLVSNGLFVSEPTSSQVQFMHQSLYDYVYARLFYSKGLSIDNILSGVHQGLFIRLRLKQILFYLRDIDEDAYLQNFSELLFAADRDGKGKYRFHLKHLMLSNLGFLTDLTAKEKYFVEKKILANQSYADIYIDSINTWVGLDLYTSYVNRYGGISSLKDEKQIQLINACERVLYTNPHNTISYLNSIDFVGLSTESKKAIQRVANRMPVEDATVEQILLLIKKLEDEESALTLEHLLVSLIPYCPDYVGNKLVEYVKHIVDAIEGGFSSHDINIGYELDYILDELKDKEPKVAFEVTIKLVEYLGRKSVLEVQNDITIKTSRVFYLYHRHDDFGSFTDKLLSYVLDSAEKYAQNDDVDFRERLRSYADSDLAVMVVIATCAYTKNINGYVKEAFNLSKRLLASEFTSSLLDYNAKELFKVMFPLLSREDKDEIMATLGRLSPKWEITLAKDKKNDRGYSYIGYTRAHYYGMLSEEDIAFYPEALKFRDEKLRVFKTLENHEPFKTSFMSGWRTLSPDWYQSFTVPELVKTMLEITNDFNHNWEAPTKTGHAMAIRQQIPNRADDVYEAYMKALDDPELDQDYPIYGIEAFIEMSYNKDLIDALVCKILSTYSKRLDELAASHVIQTCRIVDKYYDKNLTIPDQLFEFVCRIAMEWDDSEYKTEEGSKQSYTEGINQVRGCAAETLLRCYDEPNRYDRIFAALQCVAENGAVSTRAAVLFRFGAFMKAGHDRCLKLFLDMTSDYATSLLKLPVHNLNPLLYLMNDYFDELKPYFEECIKNKETHLVNTYLLWIAWVRKLDGAEKMMYRMADSSIEGRASLIKEIDGHYIQHLNSIIPVLYRYVNYDEQETASAYDIYFNRNIQHWPNEIRLPFVDEFVRSAACKYCSHYFMEFLQYYATIDPISTLKWLPMVYERKGSENSWACSPSKLIDILLLAYNSIVKFDRNDPTLEDALDLLDVWLHNNDNRQYLYNCFKLLEE